MNVSFGQDCIKDTFYPFGSADMLQVACDRPCRPIEPTADRKVYDMITHDAAKILDLKDYGLEGKVADPRRIGLQTVKDAIRLQPARRYVIKKGKVIAKSERKEELYL